jgi:hypothetical protein
MAPIATEDLIQPVALGSMPQECLKFTSHLMQPDDIDEAHVLRLSEVDVVEIEQAVSEFQGRFLSRAKLNARY